jgi:mRNA interferase RelE/StbE
MYKLKIKRTAEKDMRVLPRQIFLRINQSILELRVEPRPVGVRKLAGALAGWRIRVGDYRIIYSIDDSAETVVIVRVRHRREVYR